MALQTEAADQIELQAPTAPAGMEKALLSVDGAIIPLMGGDWAEVKTLVVGEVTSRTKHKGEQEGVTQALSYFSRLVDAQRFQHLTYIELQLHSGGRGDGWHRLAVRLCRFPPRRCPPDPGFPARRTTHHGRGASTIWRGDTGLSSMN